MFSIEQLLKTLKLPCNAIDTKRTYTCRRELVNGGICNKAIGQVRRQEVPKLLVELHGALHKANETQYILSKLAEQLLCNGDAGKYAGSLAREFQQMLVNKNYESHLRKPAVREVAASEVRRRAAGGLDEKSGRGFCVDVEDSSNATDYHNTSTINQSMKIHNKTINNYAIVPGPNTNTSKPKSPSSLAQSINASMTLSITPNDNLSLLTTRNEEPHNNLFSTRTLSMHSTQAVSTVPATTIATTQSPALDNRIPSDQDLATTEPIMAGSCCTADKEQRTGFFGFVTAVAGWILVSLPTTLVAGRCEHSHYYGLEEPRYPRTSLSIRTGASIAGRLR